MNNSILITILLGAIGSLVAAGIWVYIDRLLFYLSGFFRHRSLVGEWNTAYYEGERKYCEVARVRRVFHRVKGEIFNLDNERTYVFSGTVRERVLVATYEAKHGRQTAIDRGAFTLLVESERVMTGKYCWTDDKRAHPLADRFGWEKSDALKLDKSKIDGNGVFTRKPFGRNDRLGFFEGNYTDTTTKYSVSFSGKQIQPTGILKFINHSCAPNAHFTDDRWLMATEAIQEGAKITVDYLNTESEITHHFECKCGSVNCRKRL
ncbi:MAG: SET domain-containing protein-lysine N-methyltransferase, partial [Nitrososphaera sp.]|nr:SET domain-containing protein-lysine N-methyltransferase [Nitrososphaera sp.]